MPARLIEEVSYGELRSVTEPESVSLTRAQLDSLLHHPLAREDDTALVLLRRGGRVVGRMGLLPGLVSIGGECHRVFYGSDWRVDPEERTGGAGAHLLLRAVRRAGGSFVGFGVSETALPIYRAAHFSVAYAPRFARLVRSGPWLRRRSGALGALAPLADLALRARRVTSRRGERPEMAERFDEAIDALEPLRGDPHTFRGHRELNWAREWPWLPPENGGILAYRMGTVHAPVAYAAARVRALGDARHGTVLRFGALPERAAGFLAGVLDDLAERGADVVEVTTSAPIARAAALACGLQERAGMHLVLKFGPEPLAALRAIGRAAEDFAADSGEADLLLS